MASKNVERGLMRRMKRTVLNEKLRSLFLKERI